MSVYQQSTTAIPDSLLLFQLCPQEKRTSEILPDCLLYAQWDKAVYAANVLLL